MPLILRGRAARFLHRHPNRQRIIRLTANGHTNASIAELMGTTEGTFRNRRQRIRRLLEYLLPLDPLVDYDRSGGNQQRDPVGLCRPAKAESSVMNACLSPQIDTPKGASPDVGLAPFFYRQILDSGHSYPFYCHPRLEGFRELGQPARSVLRRIHFGGYSNLACIDVHASWFQAAK